MLYVFLSIIVYIYEDFRGTIKLFDISEFRNGTNIRSRIDADWYTTLFKFLWGNSNLS